LTICQTSTVTLSKFLRNTLITPVSEDSLGRLITNSFWEDRTRKLHQKVKFLINLQAKVDWMKAKNCWKASQLKTPSQRSKSSMLLTSPCQGEESPRVLTRAICKDQLRSSNPNRAKLLPTIYRASTEPLTNPATPQAFSNSKAVTLQSLVQNQNPTKTRAKRKQTAPKNQRDWS